LTGDTSDNIPRLKKGWQKKKTAECISACSSEKELVKVVFDEIKKVRNEQREEIEQRVLTQTGCKVEVWEPYLQELVEKDFRLRGQLVNLRSKPDEMWEIPK